MRAEQKGILWSPLHFPAALASFGKGTLICFGVLGWGGSFAPPREPFVPRSARWIGAGLVC